MFKQFQFEVFCGTDRDLFISQDVPGDDPDLVRISIDQLPALIGALQNLQNELANQE